MYFPALHFSYTYSHMYFYIQNNLYSNNETEAQETDYFAVKMFSHSKINSIKNLKHHNTVAGDVSNEKIGIVK